VADAVRSTLEAVGVPLVLSPIDDGADVARNAFVELLLEGRMGALLVTERQALTPTLASVVRSGHLVAAVGVAAPPAGMHATTFDDAADVILRAPGRWALDASVPD